MPERALIIDTVANGWTVRSPHSAAEVYVFESMAALQLALPKLLMKPKFLNNPLLDESLIAE